MKERKLVELTEDAIVQYADKWEWLKQGTQGLVVEWKEVKFVHFTTGHYSSLDDVEEVIKETSLVEITKKCPNCGVGVYPIEVGDDDYGATVCEYCKLCPECEGFGEAFDGLYLNKFCIYCGGKGWVKR